MAFIWKIVDGKVQEWHSTGMQHTCYASWASSPLARGFLLNDLSRVLEKLRVARPREIDWEEYGLKGMT